MLSLCRSKVCQFNWGKMYVWNQEKKHRRNKFIFRFFLKIFVQNIRNLPFWLLDYVSLMLMRHSKPLLFSDNSTNSLITTQSFHGRIQPSTLIVLGPYWFLTFNGFILSLFYSNYRIWTCSFSVVHVFFSLNYRIWTCLFSVVHVFFSLNYRK